MQTTRHAPGPDRSSRGGNASTRRRLVLLLALLFAGIGWAQADLFEAATRGDRDAVLAALQGGEDIDVRDAYGQTPLMYAISHGQPTDFIELLVQHGADVNARTEAGWTPLMYAARDLDGRHFAHVVLLLYNAGADPTATNAEGKTARHYRRPEPPQPPAEPPPPTGPPVPAEPPPPADPTVGTVDALGEFLAREAGFAADCGSRDAFYVKQWCGYRGTPLPFEAFLRQWDAALHHASGADDVPEARRDWTRHRGVHVAFYDVDEGSLGVSYDPAAGLVLLTLR